MVRITSVGGRILYNSRGSKTIEVDVVSDGRFLGRVCAPSGASVGRHEATSFPEGGPEQSLRVLHDNSQRFVGLDPSAPSDVHGAIRGLDGSPGYSVVGGSLAFAVSIAAAESASRASGEPLFVTLARHMASPPSPSPSSPPPSSPPPLPPFRFPFPLGNILGGGAHAGPGTPDIQEILVCPVGSRTIEDAIGTNLAVHRELRRVLEAKDPDFTNGRGDEGGWAPRMDNRQALDASAEACENLGYALGREVSLGVDFAASTQWNEERQVYVYDRAGKRGQAGAVENSSGEQIDFVADIIDTYKLIYAEDAVHEEAFGDMAELTSRFPHVLITGDDLTVTNRDTLARAVGLGSCNAAILKVNQAGGLYDALGFAAEAARNDIGLITSHRSGESTDPHISHIGIATRSKMLKVGVVGGERVAKLNELLRLSSSPEHDLICGMADLGSS